MKRFYILSMLLSIMVFTATASATIHEVHPGGSIQDCIDGSLDGDTCLVHPGTYVENINFSAHNIVLGSLFLTSEDPDYISATIIDGGEAGSVITLGNGEDSTTQVTGFTIQNGNVQNGGGIYCWGCSTHIGNNIIKDNRAGEGGGGIWCGGSSKPTIKGNIIVGNSTTDAGSGGGINCLSGSNAIIEHNIIIGNKAQNYGGGIDCHAASPVIKNNTITGDSTNIDGGGIAIRDGSPTVTNTIFWDNYSPNSREIHVSGTFHGSITYCDVQGGWEGETNIDIDPLFRDPENSDFHLMSTDCDDPANSPCIDTGSPFIFDERLDCNWGLGSPRSDIGAYGGIISLSGNGEGYRMIVGNKDLSDIVGWIGGRITIPVWGITPEEVTSDSVVYMSGSIASDDYFIDFRFPSEEFDPLDTLPAHSYFPDSLVGQWDVHLITPQELDTPYPDFKSQNLYFHSPPRSEDYFYTGGDTVIIGYLVMDVADNPDLFYFETYCDFIINGTYPIIWGLQDLETYFIPELFFSCLFITFGPITIISGTITDVFSDPIADVWVMAECYAGPTYYTQTDFDGVYYFFNVEGDELYDFYFMHPAYRDTVIDFVYVPEGGIVIDVIMSSETEPIPALSEWGMLIMGLLLLAIGTVAVVRRKKSAPSKAA